MAVVQLPQYKEIHAIGLWHTGRVVPAGGEVEFFNKNDKAAALIRRFVVSAAATLRKVDGQL